MSDVRRGSAGRVRAAVTLAFGVLALGACGDGGNGVGDGPASIEAISPDRDTVEAGLGLDPPLQVRVTDGAGDPVAGVTVRFRVTIGPGRVSEPRVQTGSDGRASTVYGDAERVGTARVEADLPEEPGVGKVAFSIRVVAPTSTGIQAVGGDGQEAETGSQLPRRLQVEVLSPGGIPVGGVPVDWRIEGSPGGGGDGGRLLVDTTYTGEDGRTWNLLTLGGEAGEYVVSALSAGADEAAAFTATAVDSLPGDVVLDSVAPRPLDAGAKATVHGSGFAGSATSDRVWIEGVEATVLTAFADSLRIRVPGFDDRCLPARTVGVRVEVDAGQSEALAVRLNPAGGFLSLSVGQRATRAVPPERGCVQVDSAAAGRAYRIVAQSASQVSGASTPMRLILRSGEEVGAATTMPAATSVSAPSVPPWIMEPADRGLSLRTRLQLRARQELLRRPGGAARGSSPPAAHRASPPAAAEAPEPGETLRLFLPISQNLSVSCTDTSTAVTAVVREVGDRVALLEDTVSPDGSLSSAQLETLAREMDDAIFTTDTSYFGPPGDVDGNGRVLVLLTPEVNRLTPKGSEAFVGGFFLPTDLVDSGDEEGAGVLGPGGEICPSSNEAEIVYLATADPLGQFGIQVSRERAIRNARSVSAHELEHLFSAAQRMVHREGWVTDLESAWLGEGLAHLAEEAAGLAVRDLATRDNLDYADVTFDREAFEAFFFNNLARGGLFMQSPAETFTIIGSDPGGLESLKMRGFGWLLARWLGDHYGPGPDGSGGPVRGSREELLFRDLSAGGSGSAQGIDNVLRAVESVHGSRPSWGEIMEEFASMLAVDDDVSGLADRVTLPSWNLRDVYRGIYEGGRGGTEPFTRAYPLRVVESDVTSAAFDFDVNASGELYFEVGRASASPAFSLALRSQGGGELPAGARASFTVIRVR